MSIDGGIIDADHQVLIEIINAFKDRKATGLKTDEALKVAHKLRRYTEMHFAREERLQELIKFGLRYPHQRQHQRLISDLRSFEQKLEEGDLGARSSLLDAFEAFISEWLIHHVLKEDMKMKAQLNELRRQQRDMKSLEELVREREAHQKTRNDNKMTEVPNEKT